MLPMILQLDDALDGQAELGRAVSDAGGTSLAARDLGPALRLWTRRGPMAELQRRLSALRAPSSEALLVFAGSGDFHHVTSLLIARAADAAGEPLTVLHFDNHPDWVRYARGRHCGSWVGTAARLPGVRKVITIGVCSPDIGHRRARAGDLDLIAEDRLALYAWSHPDGDPVVRLAGHEWPTIESLGAEAFLSRLEQEITTKAIYVTIDKDVLCPAEAVTNWDQGRASMDFLASAIRVACAGRRLTGADVVGDWSRPVYGPDPLAWMLKFGEAFLDQPPARGLSQASMPQNQCANLRLLNLFQELAP